MRQIGVSILSFPPTMYMFGGLAKIADVLGEELGIQLLPLRGLRREHLSLFNVMSFEGPWNCGGLSDVFHREVLGENDKASIIDLALFGTEADCQCRVCMFRKNYPEALAIDVPWVPGSLIELSPDMYIGNARKWDHEPSGVVLDTYHWKRFPRGHAECELRKLGGLSAVKMVHLKLLNMSDTIKFIDDEGSFENLLLQKFTSEEGDRKIPVIIEAKPNALKVKGLSRKGVLRLISKKIKEVIP